MADGLSADSLGITLTEYDIQPRKAFVALEAADIERIWSAAITPRSY